MRCYRIARRDPMNVAGFVAATGAVRELTGVWDVPMPPTPQQRAGWERPPRSRFVPADFGGPEREVLTQPGRLCVWRSMTLFCRRTRAAPR
jgi:hypothetical protein